MLEDDFTWGDERVRTEGNVCSAYISFVLLKSLFTSLPIFKNPTHDTCILSLCKIATMYEHIKSKI